MKNYITLALLAAVALIGLMWSHLPVGAPALSESVHSAERAGSEEGTVEPHTVILLAEGEPVTSASVQERLCGASPSCQNGADGVDVGFLKNGVMPEQPTLAVVETDTNCNADAYGLSHCSNILRLPDGGRIEIRHDHNMQVYPCLDPGETVTVEGQSFASS
jgi:hypothetical protein